MAEAGFRLPGASYEDLVNIIVAYGTRDEASNPGDVGKLDSVHRASASRTNGFLVEIGVLKGEREKLVTRRGRDLALALDSRDDARSRTVWRQIVSTSEFLQNVVSAVKFREGMPYETVQAYIAHSAGQPRNKPVMIGSSTIIEILKSARLLKEGETGMISVAHEGDILEPPTGIEGSQTDSREQTEEPGGAPSAEAELESVLPSGDEIIATVESPEATVNIHLHVRCDADELEDMGPRLKALIRSLKETGEPETRTPEPDSFADVSGDLTPPPDFAEALGSTDFYQKK